LRRVYSSVARVSPSTFTLSISLIGYPASFTIEGEHAMRQESHSMSGYP
jgi:hypothetical protein